MQVRVLKEHIDLYDIVYKYPKKSRVKYTCLVVQTMKTVLETLKGAYYQ